MRIGVEIEFLRKLGDNIKRQRLFLNLSQDKLSEVIGCHVNHIGRIERGQTDPSISMIVKIARALKISVPELLS